MREILGLGREWGVVIVGAGKIGAALAQYRGFRQRGFTILAAYDNSPDKIGRTLEGIEVRDIANLERDIQRDKPDIVVLTVPGDEAQRVVDRVVHVGVRPSSTSPRRSCGAGGCTIKTVNMAMEKFGRS